MNKKQVFILLSLLVILIPLTIIFRPKQKQYSPKLQLGDPILSRELTRKDLQKIELTKLKEKTLIEKNENAYLVTSREGFATDPHIMQYFFENMNKLKVIQVIPGGHKELSRFQLDDKGLKLKLHYQDSSSEELILGKPYTRDNKAVGRYIYLPKVQEVLVVNKPLGNIAVQADLWLKKVLPHIKSIASISLFRNSSLQWQAERENLQSPFSMSFPSHLKKMQLARVKELVQSCIRLSYLDLALADNDFEEHKLLSPLRMEFTTWDGGQYSLDFLGLDKQQKVRCQVSISHNKNSQAELDFAESEITQILEEWQFSLEAPALQKVLGFFGEK